MIKIGEEGNYEYVFVLNKLTRMRKKNFCILWMVELSVTREN